jgi:ABC-type transport system substrate-binding protein
MLRQAVSLVALACVMGGGGEVLAQAPAPKTLRLVFPSPEASFDPGSVSDEVSISITENIIEPLLRYDYLARPAKLIPNTAESLPEVSADGRTYTFRVQKGIHFTPDPVFRGKPRELVAVDYAYTIRRHFDPKLKSPSLWLFAGKIVGADAAREGAQKSGHYDYDAPVSGLETPDRYTLRLRLAQPDRNFAQVFAMAISGAMAREAVEFYGQDIGGHPIGTGPFVLKDYRRANKIVLEANPRFRELRFVGDPGGDKARQVIAEKLQGKRLPLVQRVEVAIIEEPQSRWLAFLNGEIDVLPLPRDLAELAHRQGKLSPELAARGVRLQVHPVPNVYFSFFNMDDPVVGGYTPEKIALRRAIGLAYDTDDAIRQLFKGEAIPARQIIPEDVYGHDAKAQLNATRFNPAEARALLDRFGYRDRDGDGYRELPDGKPLVLERASVTSTEARQADEFWKRSMDAIGIRLSFRKDKLPELRKLHRAGKIQVMSEGWNADYPDGENFLQLLYGPNAGQENAARFKLAEFDKLYEETRNLPDSPERLAKFRRMTELVIAYAPWRLTHHLTEHDLVQPWVVNYLKHSFQASSWIYTDIDPSKRRPRS